MITDLPTYVYITFFGALVFALVIFYFASGKNSKLLLGILFWGLFQSILAFSGFYENTDTIPPRLILLIFPVPLIVFFSIFSSDMKNWLASLNLKYLTYLHSVRIPVELVLLWLFIARYVPELMTFEGRNFDILAGFTAPMVALLAFRKDKVNRPLLWVWNIFSIALLANVLINAVLSIPTVFQQFAFDQPNIAVLKFPFLLLPGIIVPIVLLSIISSFVILNRSSN